MANMIDLESFREHSLDYNFETRSLYVLERIGSTFSLVPVNLVHIELSNINQNWPRFNIISNVDFIVNSPLVPCILSGVFVKPMGVMKLFCHYPY